MTTSLIINGAAGRMGRRITALAVENGNFDITAALEHTESMMLGMDAGEVAGVGNIDTKISSEKPDGADVMIDFTLAAAADETISYCLSSGTALIMGTTGLSEKQLAAVKSASEKIAVIQATNMSVGMNVLFEMAKNAASMLGDEYDIEIIEQHHRFKKDSPSGSALTLAERAAEGAGLDYPACLQHGREGGDCLRKKGTIGMHAVRCGDIIGEHEVLYSCLGETVKLSHSAHNRDNFVRGAIRAAHWIAGKKPGLYTMKDVLGL
ncbi:4-hydroxy-tetrahydrodipicolinate reductase [Limihaloglobus sulfuriphilus]|uniref:4-hydroxy-tetrahydrodipicolinate reductase n=1 Tax=Limihaloglobus sulfuriphilus TaxID=1851148 RepID=A0A1Q2MDP2_9BACT|nr:4-hydroxy-tetrahydrodipicolinate reductase [Limihaloglobus sulfuriphilus]AQQ70382.1 4-hydroxy-tetrahydrodipicolinate reductase [Limihaloglobus sulfuriphilus]